MRPPAPKPPLPGGGHPVHTKVNTSPNVNTLQKSTRPQKSTPRLAKLFLPGGGHPETTKVNTPQKSARFRVNKPPNVNTSRGEASSSRSFCESQFPHKSVNLFFMFFISRIIKFFPGAASLWAPKSMRLQSKQVSRIQQAFVTTQGPSWGYLKVRFQETLSSFGDKCPQNGSKNDPMVPRTTLGCPHEGPRVDTPRLTKPSFQGGSYPQSSHTM